jgi:hypothetical protein
MTPGAVAGILLVLIGLLLTLDNYNVLNASAWLRFWPVLLILIGVLKATRPASPGSRIMGLVIAAIGLVMTLDRTDIIHISIWGLWPLLLVALGVSFVLRTHSRVQSGSDSDSDSVRGSAILGGMEQKITSRHFAGGKVSALLGGHDIDLRDADIAEHGEAVLDVFAFMGGVAIKVPASWTVVVDGSAILGGFENKAAPAVSGLKTLRVTGMAFMGGVEIKS